jgi:hypothetical protein
MSIDNLSHCRAVLLRVTASLSVEELDYRAFPDSKSNGEILLHIAGFEFLTLAAASFARGERVDLSPWPMLKGGFAREAGFVPPEGRALQDYIGRLAVIRELTAAFLVRDAQAGAVRADDFPIAAVARDLSAAHGVGDESCYERLAPAVMSSFRDDGAVDAHGMVDVPTVLLLHESYHRGQITLNKYLRSRLLLPGKAGSAH